MDHVAFMKKSWGLTAKILRGQKRIESRWYSLRCRPWDGIKAGDTVYFKDSGEPIKLKAEVKKVIQFIDLTPSKVKEILNKYGADDGLEKGDISEFFEMFKNKKYCILIFLQSPKVIKPLEIDKAGFGAMAAWITVNNILNIKK